MAYTQTDLDQIDAAIATGALEVELSGKRIKYRSMRELMQARAHVAAQLTPPARRGSVFRPSFTTARGD